MSSQKIESVKVYKVRQTARIPLRTHETDAGMDFFYCPEEGVSMTIPPNETVLLSTGVKVEVPSGYMLQVMNKSGIASKRSLLCGACVVDEGYTGEIFVNLHNIGKTAQTVEPHQKIAQGVFVKISQPALVEIKDDNIYEKETTRGAGALGSTGDR